jgi:ABC-type phosphate transport system substrate-binding protein
MRHPLLPLVIIALVLCLTFANPSKAEPAFAIAFVVNPSTNIGDLSIADIRKLFLGVKGKLPNGRHAVLLMTPAGTPERAVVLREIYKMNESEFAKYILQSAFTGRQSPPREVNGVQMKQIVSEDPSAIGYLPISEVDQGVRPVLVIR